MKLSEELAREDFCDSIGMTAAKMRRVGITMVPCDCGLDTCNGWLAKAGPLPR